MLEQARGAIINTGARSALASGANEVAYSASKSAVARITESLAAAYKSKGITVNAAMPKADHSRWVRPEAIAQVILFLASDAATIINGALIPAYGLS
jgi:NAD(P)-dependent dehydrogenase (short-subunit alcohol dehydrogenase family)